MSDKIPLGIATKARSLGFRVNRKGWTINKLPIPGGSFVVSIGGGGGGQMLAFGSPGLVAGSLLANALVSRGQLRIEFTAADGRRATKTAPARAQQAALALGDWLHNLTITDAA